MCNVTGIEINIHDSVLPDLLENDSLGATINLLCHGTYIYIRYALS